MANDKIDKNYWATNVAKGIGLSAFSTIKDEVPKFSDSIAGSIDFLKGESSTFKDIYNVMRDAGHQFKKNIYDDMIIKGFGNVKKDIMSGNIYNPDKMMNSMMGGGFDEDDGFFEDSDFDAYDTDNPTPDPSGSVGDKILNKTFNNLDGGSGTPVDVDIKSTKWNIGTDVMLHNNLLRGLQNVYKINTRLDNFNKVETISFYNDTYKFYEKNIELLSAIGTTLEETKEMKQISNAHYGIGRKGILSSVGDMSDGGLMSSAKEFVESMIGPESLAVMMGQGIAEDPIGFLMKQAMGHMLPKDVKKLLGGLDKSFGGIGKKALIAAKRGAKNDGSILSMFSSFINKHLKDNVEERGSNTNRLAGFDKTAVPFDGMVRKSLVNVIPTYLRKTLNVNEHIFQAINNIGSAVSDNYTSVEMDRTSELIFDSSKGTFSKHKDLVKFVDNATKDISRRALKDISVFDNTFENERNIVDDDLKVKRNATKDKILANESMTDSEKKVEYRKINLEYKKDKELLDKKIDDEMELVALELFQNKLKFYEYDPTSKNDRKKLAEDLEFLLKYDSGKLIYNSMVKGTVYDKKNKETKEIKNILNETSGEQLKSFESYNDMILKDTLDSETHANVFASQMSQRDLDDKIKMISSNLISSGDISGMKLDGDNVSDIENVDEKLNAVIKIVKNNPKISSMIKDGSITRESDFGSMESSLRGYTNDTSGNEYVKNAISDIDSGKVYANNFFTSESNIYDKIQTDADNIIERSISGIEKLASGDSLETAEKAMSKVGDKLTEIWDSSPFGKKDRKVEVNLDDESKYKSKSDKSDLGNKKSDFDNSFDAAKNVASSWFNKVVGAPENSDGTGARGFEPVDSGYSRIYAVAEDGKTSTIKPIGQDTHVTGVRPGEVIISKQDVDRVGSGVLDNLIKVSRKSNTIKPKYEEVNNVNKSAAEDLVNDKNFQNVLFKKSGKLMRSSRITFNQILVKSKALLSNMKDIDLPHEQIADRVISSLEKDQSRINVVSSFKFDARLKEFEKNTDDSIVEVIGKITDAGKSWANRKKIKLIESSVNSGLTTTKSLQENEKRLVEMVGDDKYQEFLTKSKIVAKEKSIRGEGYRDFSTNTAASFVDMMIYKDRWLATKKVEGKYRIGVSSGFISVERLMKDRVFLIPVIGDKKFNKYYEIAKDKENATTIKSLLTNAAKATAFAAKTVAYLPLSAAKSFLKSMRYKMFTRNIKKGNITEDMLNNDPNIRGFVFKNGGNFRTIQSLIGVARKGSVERSSEALNKTMKRDKATSENYLKSKLNIFDWYGSRKEFKKYKRKLKSGEYTLDGLMEEESSIKSALGGGVQGWMRFDELKMIGERSKKVLDNEKIFDALDKTSRARYGDFFMDRVKTHIRKKVGDTVGIALIKRKIRIGLIDMTTLIERDFQEALINKYGYKGYMEIYQYSEEIKKKGTSKSIVMYAKMAMKSVARGMRNVVGGVLSKPLAAIVRTLSPGNKILAAKVALKTKYGKVTKDDLVSHNDRLKDGEKLYGNTDPKSDVFKTNDEWLQFINKAEAAYQVSKKKDGGIFSLSKIKARETDAKTEFDKKFGEIGATSYASDGGVVSAISDIDGLKEARRLEKDKLDNFTKAKSEGKTTFIEKTTDKISDTTGKILNKLGDIAENVTGSNLGLKDKLDDIKQDNPKDVLNSGKKSKKIINENPDPKDKLLTMDLEKSRENRKTRMLTYSKNVEEVKKYSKISSNSLTGRSSNIDSSDNKSFLGGVNKGYLINRGFKFSDEVTEKTQETNDIQREQLDFMKGRANTEDTRYERDSTKAEKDKLAKEKREREAKEAAEREADRLANQARKDALKYEKAFKGGGIVSRSSSDDKKKDKDGKNPLNPMDLAMKMIPGLGAAMTGAGTALGYGKKAAVGVGKGVRGTFNFATGGKYIRPAMVGPMAPKGKTVGIINKIKKAFGGLRKGFSGLISRLAGSGSMVGGGKVSKVMLKGLKLLKFLGPVLFGASAFGIWKVAEKGDEQLKRALGIMRSPTKYSYNVLTKEFGAEIAKAIVLVQDNRELGLPIAEELIKQMQEDLRGDMWKNIGIEAAELAIDAALMFAGPVGWAAIAGRHLLGIDIRSVQSFINADYVDAKYAKKKKELDTLSDNISKGVENWRASKTGTSTNLTFSLMDGKISEKEEKTFTKNIVNEQKSAGAYRASAFVSEYMTKNKKVRKMLSQNNALAMVGKIGLLAGKDYDKVRKEIGSGSSLEESALKSILGMSELNKFINMSDLKALVAEFLKGTHFTKYIKNEVGGEINFHNVMSIDISKLQDWVTRAYWHSSQKKAKRARYIYIIATYLKIYKITYSKIDEVMQKVNSKIDIIDLKIAKIKEGMKKGTVGEDVGKKALEKKNRELLSMLKAEKAENEKNPSIFSKISGGWLNDDKRIEDLEDKLNPNDKAMKAKDDIVKNANELKAGAGKLLSFGKSLFSGENKSNVVPISKVSKLTKSKMVNEDYKIASGQEGEGDVVNENNKINKSNVIPIDSKTKDAKTYVLNNAPKAISFLNNRAKRGFYSDNMDATIAERFTRMAVEYYEMTGAKVPVNSTVRSIAHQNRLWLANNKKVDALKGAKAKRIQRGKVATPGRSMHQIGKAIDANSSTMNHAYKLGLLQKHNLYRPLAKVNKSWGTIEDWHVETPEIKTPKAKNAARSKYYKARPMEKAVYNKANPKRQIGDGYDDISANVVNEKLLEDMLKVLNNIQSGLGDGGNGGGGNGGNNDDVVMSIKQLSLAILSAFGSQSSDVQNIKNEIKTINQKSPNKPSVNNIAKNINNGVVNNGKNNYKILNRG